MGTDHGFADDEAFEMPGMSDTPGTHDSESGNHFTPLEIQPTMDRIHRPADPEALAIEQDEKISGRFLSAIELEVVFYIERYHSTVGEAPTDSQLMERYSNIDEAWLAEFKRNDLAQKSFERRGIVYPPKADYLSARQLAAVAAMLAYTDRRSDEKKLRDLGITPREWAGWLQDEMFAAYLRERSERMLSNTTFEAHLGLIKGMRNGNTASIQMHNKMTGRYNENEENAVDVRLLLHTFIEVIQRHISDPLVLHRIAGDLSNVAAREQFTTNTAQRKAIRGKAV